MARWIEEEVITAFDFWLKNTSTLAASARQPRRQQVLRRVLDGWTITQIASDLKIVKQQVCGSIRKLCLQEGVANRRELARKLDSPHFQPLDSDRSRPPAGALVDRTSVGQAVS